MYWGLVRVGDGLLTRRESPSSCLGGLPNSAEGHCYLEFELPWLSLSSLKRARPLALHTRFTCPLTFQTRELQDNFTAEWDPEVIADTLQPYVLQNRIDTVRHGAMPIS